MPKVRLRFKSASEIVDVGGEGLLLLTDEQQKRQIAVVCNLKKLKDIAQGIDGKKKYETNLAQTLWRILEDYGVELEIYIDAIKEQQYHAIVCDTDSSVRFPICMTDAVLLVIISKGSVPLYMDERLFDNQSSPYHGGLEGVQLPVNVITNQMLFSALDKAIKDENYELASHLRDEIRRRKASAEENE